MDVLFIALAADLILRRVSAAQKQAADSHDPIREHCHPENQVFFPTMPFVTTGW
jgi:hypothetical protein